MCRRPQSAPGARVSLRRAVPAEALTPHAARRTPCVGRVGARQGGPDFKPGDEVFGMLPYPYGFGSHAEYVTGPARAFAAKPAGIDHVQAGALPLAALTAWQALVETADVRAGQRVLIHAAAGGVGHLAVQIAKERGAHVTGTASAPKHDFLRGLGADACVDYRTEDFTDTGQRYDVVLDALGGETATRSV